MPESDDVCSLAREGTGLDRHDHLSDALQDSGRDSSPAAHFLGNEIAAYNMRNSTNASFR